MYDCRLDRANDTLHLLKELKLHRTYLAVKCRCNVFFVKHISEKNLRSNFMALIKTHWVLIWANILIRHGDAQWQTAILMFLFSKSSHIQIYRILFVHINYLEIIWDQEHVFCFVFFITNLFLFLADNAMLLERSPNKCFILTVQTRKCYLSFTI